nr:hypothetical protein [Tanacetum cinerariifolium]
RNSKAYKEYHACAMGEAAPKPKASARNKNGTGSKPGVPDVPSDDSEEELSWKSSDDEDVGSHKEGKNSDESDDDRDEGNGNFDPIPITPEESEEESNDEEEQESRLSEEA